MKTVFKALAISFVIHVVFIIGVITFGYIQTKINKPEIDNAWDNVVVLQDEVAFGVIGSPFILLFTFLWIALISGLFSLNSTVKKDASPNIG